MTYGLRRHVTARLRAAAEAEAAAALDAHVLRVLGVDAGAEADAEAWTAAPLALAA